MKTAPRWNPHGFRETFPSNCQGFANQVIASDFARLQAETQAAEEAAKAEYEEFMEDSKVPRGCQGDAKLMPRGCQGDAKGMPRGCQGDAKGMPRGCQGDAKGMPRGPAVLGLPASRLEELFCWVEDVEDFSLGFDQKFIAE